MNFVDPMDLVRPQLGASLSVRRPAPDALPEADQRAQPRPRLDIAPHPTRATPQPPSPQGTLCGLRYDAMLSAPHPPEPAELVGRIDMAGASASVVLGLIESLATTCEGDREEVANTLRVLRQRGAAAEQLPLILHLQESAGTYESWLLLTQKLAALTVLKQDEVVADIVALLRDTAPAAQLNVIADLARVFGNTPHAALRLLQAYTSQPISQRETFATQVNRLYALAPPTTNLTRVTEALARVGAPERDHIFNALAPLSGLRLTSDQFEDTVELLARNVGPHSKEIMELTRPLAFDKGYASQSWHRSSDGARYGGYSDGGFGSVSWVDVPRVFFGIPAGAWGLALKLLGPHDDANHFSGPKVLEILAATPPEHRETTLLQVKKLAAGKNANVTPGAMACFLKKVAFEHREAFMNAVEALGVLKTSGNARADFLAQLTALPASEWDSFVQAVHAASAHATCKGRDLARLAQEIAAVAAEERAPFAELIEATCGTRVRSQLRYMMARFLRMVPFDARASFADEARRYARSGANASPLHLRKVIEALTVVPGADPVQSVSQALRLRRAGTSAFHAEEILRTIAKVPTEHQVEFTDRMLGLGFSQSLAYDAFVHLNQHLLPSLMVEFLRICEPLALHNVTDDVRLRLFGVVASTVPASRAQHLQQLLALGDDPNDDENVMRTKAINATHDAIRAFLPMAPKDVDVDMGLTEMIAFFSAYFASRPAQTLAELAHPHWGRASAAEKRFAQRVRVNDGACEFNNFVRVIEGDHAAHSARALNRQGDYSSPLRRSDLYTYGAAGESIRIANLLVRLWQYIKVYPGYEHNNETVEQAQANMRYGVFTALCFCVEQDAHVVCGVGFIRRIMSILQGRIPGAMIDERPPVAQAFNDACQRFFMQPTLGTTGEPVLDDDGLVQFEQKDVYKRRSPAGAELRVFYAEALSKAEHIYGLPRGNNATNHAYNLFIKHTLEFLDVSYGWAPHVDDAKYDAG